MLEIEVVEAAWDSASALSEGRVRGLKVRLVPEAAVHVLSLASITSLFPISHVFKEFHETA